MKEKLIIKRLLKIVKDLCHCYYWRMKKLLQNRKAFFDFEIQEKIEAGVELEGFEVKSLRKGQGSLLGAYVTVSADQATLKGASIPPFQPKNIKESYDPERPRRLLLNKKELTHLVAIEKQKGLTIIPISVYNKGRFLKVEIAIVRGKKKYDKRESIKKRDTDREIRRTLKKQY